MTKYLNKNRIVFYLILIFIFLNSINYVIFTNAIMTGTRSIYAQGKIVYTYSARPLHVDGTLIKDDLGNVIHLRGTTHYGFEQYPSGGHWAGQFFRTYEDWDIDAYRLELDEMRSWGINVVRFTIAIDLWKFNTESHQEIIKALLTEMAEREMYMIYAPTLIASRGTGDVGGALPYPPYQYSDATHIIADKSDFVNFWTSVASELKDHPNVIFEFWNEPGYGSVGEAQRILAFNSWSDTTQQCIDAVRATGATQLIIVQWRHSSSINLDYPPPEDPTPNSDFIVPPPWGGTVDWAWYISANDPLGNIIYSTHIYRHHGSFHRQTGSIENRIQLWEHNDIVTCLELMKLKKLAQIHPVIIGEIGCDMDCILDPAKGRTDPDVQHELAAFDSALSIFNEWGLHWCSWWWHDHTWSRQHSGFPNYTPNAVGEIVIQYLGD